MHLPCENNAIALLQWGFWQTLAKNPKFHEIKPFCVGVSPCRWHLDQDPSRPKYPVLVQRRERVFSWKSNPGAPELATDGFSEIRARIIFDFRGYLRGVIRMR
jgi:hypothetical protein